MNSYNLDDLLHPSVPIPCGKTPTIITVCDIINYYGELMTVHQDLFMQPYVIIGITGRYDVTLFMDLNIYSAALILN